MKTQLSMAALVVASLLSGCATRANSVAPVSVAASDYSGMSCADARQELTVSREKVNALSRRQNNAAVADAASVFLFLLPLGSVFGADVAGELAQAKGETLALERRVRSGCDGGQFTDDSRPAQPTAATAPVQPASQYGPAVAPSGVAKKH